ncbi:MAG: bifunctional 3,4-dihydroxy-2-butanone-4-phosphate synthase/GTP cyclohydrolase II [Fusobacteriia bacterium 4572_74]|nr:MAG: bifunctional 3,4-dihydroxy-2-butanone-4-phosphate synthase/GTP cyclohydrolase II [Fusobacteriia bacterium 4572_74]
MLDNIKDAIEDIKQGKMIIVVDDENRENEGDIVMAADMVSYDAINFMAIHARGLTCIPMDKARAKELKLNQMVGNNTDPHGTAFTVSVDSKDTTTGIAIRDRVQTIKDLADRNKGADDFNRPGHLFPLVAKDGGVLIRTGHTEASVDFARLAGLKPMGVICEILKDDGTMARLDDLKIFAKKHNLKLVSIEDLIKYRKENDVLVNEVAVVKMPTQWGNFNLHAYENCLDDKEHIALVKGDVKNKEGVLVRIHSECFTGDVLGSRRCDCGAQLHNAMKTIDEKKEGVILYLRQEGRGIGLYNKMKAYNLQDEGFDTVEANEKLGFEADLRDYVLGSQILKVLGVKSVKLMTNNPKKIEGLKSYGIDVIERKNIEITPNEDNKRYLKTKKDKLNHMLEKV